MSEEGSTATLETPEASTGADQQTDLSLNDVYLPDDIKNDPTIKNLSVKGTVTDMAKMLLDSQKLVGADKVVIPGKDATPQEWDEVYNKLGRPDTPEAYQLKLADGLPDGLMDENLVKEFGQIAHKLGFSTKQTNGALQWYQEVVLKQHDAIEQARDKQIEDGATKMKKEWGNAFQEKRRLVNSVFNNTKHGEEAREVLKEAGLGANPAIMRWASELGASLGEDRMLGLEGGRTGGSSHTPDSARQKILELMKHPKYAAKYDHEGEAIRKQVAELMPDAYPETP